MKFEVRLNGETIGFSELEGGDPPMGVAFGQFIPTAAYKSLQQYCVERGISGLAIPGLIVHTHSGSSTECGGGIQIIDLSPELGPPGIQIHLNAIPYPQYGELFPEHVKGYKDQFRDRG